MKKLLGTEKLKKKKVKQTKSVKPQKKTSTKVLTYIGILFISLFTIVIFSSKQQSITGLAVYPSPSPIVPTFYNIGDCYANNDCPTNYPTVYSKIYPTPTINYNNPTPTVAYPTAYPTTYPTSYPTATPTITYYSPTPTVTYPTTTPTPHSISTTTPVDVGQTPLTNSNFTGGGMASNNQLSIPGLSVSQWPNAVAVIGITVQGNNTVSSVTLGSTTFTRAANSGCGGNDCDTELWYAVNPQTGNNQTLDVNVTADVDVDYGLAIFYNVDQASPVSTPAVETGDSASPSNLVSNTNTNQMVVDAAGFTDTTATAGSGQNLIWNEVFGTLWGEGSYEQGANGSTSLSWLLASSENWADIAIALNPATSSVTPTSTSAYPTAYPTTYTTVNPTINPCIYNSSTSASDVGGNANVSTMSKNSNNSVLQLLIQLIQFLFQLLQNLFGGTTVPPTQTQPTPTVSPTAYYYPTPTVANNYPTPTAYYKPTPTTAYYPTPTTYYYPTPTIANYPTPTTVYPTQNPCPPNSTPTPTIWIYPPTSTPAPTRIVYPPTSTPMPTRIIYPPTRTPTPKPIVYRPL